MTLEPQSVFVFLGVCVVAAPAALLLALSLAVLVAGRVPEALIGRITHTAIITGLLAALGVLGMMLVYETRHVTVELGNWVLLDEEHFHFTLKFVFDRLSVPFVILSYVLVGTIGAFARAYLHREPGFTRFFVFYALFLLGMVTSAVAGTIETLFAGWELVGLSSALLVAFFHDRPAPVQNGLRVWSVYRVADAAFLMAALALHHVAGAGDFEKLMGTGPWPEGEAALPSSQALSIGLLLLVAAAGKSALIPFSGWLPRAMEGPTPSSAVFYGALSVHLGAFLLLRISPLLELSGWLCAAVVGLGLLTAAFASLASRVQTDIKSALAFASLTQIGIIVAEIGLGLRYVALVHIIGHACLRTLQFLRAPTLLQDYQALENAIGERLPAYRGFRERFVPAGLRDWVYRLVLERAYLDAAIDTYIVRPFLRFFRWCDRLERRWTDFLSGQPSRASDRVQPAPETLDEWL